MPVLRELHVGDRHNQGRQQRAAALAGPGDAEQVFLADIV
jgi:hypothetical protein